MHRHKSRRQRRLAFLVEKALQSMVEHYTRELGAGREQFTDFAHEVARRLRAEVHPEWTLEQAEARALTLAETLFRELGADDTRAGDESPGDRETLGGGTEEVL